MKKRKIKPLAIFDIDGTIFRSSLLIELTKHLVRQGVFPDRAFEEVKLRKLRWLDRRGSYQAYIGKVVEVFQKYLKGVSYRIVRKVSRQIIEEQKNRVYVYTRDMLKKLRRTHTLLAISGSPMDIVEKLKTPWKFDEVFGTKYEVQRGVYTGRVLYIPSRHKEKVLRIYCEKNGVSLSSSVGVGDTESDISFLRLVSRPVAFNPNAKLLTYARARKWKIVVERKDVIYRL